MGAAVLTRGFHWNREIKLRSVTLNLISNLLPACFPSVLAHLHFIGRRASRYGSICLSLLSIWITRQWSAAAFSHSARSLRHSAAPALLLKLRSPRSSLLYRCVPHFLLLLRLVAVHVSALCKISSFISQDIKNIVMESFVIHTFLWGKTAH